MPPHRMRLTTVGSRAGSRVWIHCGCGDDDGLFRGLMWWVLIPVKFVFLVGFPGMVVVPYFVRILVRCIACHTKYRDQQHECFLPNFLCHAEFCIRFIRRIFFCYPHGLPCGERCEPSGLSLFYTQGRMARDPGGQDGRVPSRSYVMY